MLYGFIDALITIVFHSENLTKKERNYVKDEVQSAINYTRIHIDSTRDADKDVSSTIISNMWLRTSAHLKGLNNNALNDIIDTLKEKSKYWAQPEIYTMQMIENYGIQLNELQKLINNL